MLSHIYSAQRDQHYFADHFLVHDLAAMLQNSKIDYFWDSCQGAVSKVTILGPLDAIL